MADNMTTCERCGSAVPAGASVCPNCGAPVGASGYETRKVEAGWSEPEPPAYEPTIKVPEPVPASSPSPYTPSSQTPQSYTTTAPPPPPKRSLFWPIVAGCTALLVICCCLIVVAGVIVAYQAGSF